MLIVARKTDYYDYPVANYGVDKKITLRRKENIPKTYFVTAGEFIKGHYNMARYGVSSETGFYLIVVCGVGYMVERIGTKYADGGWTYEDNVVTNEHFISRHENNASNFVTENCGFQERWNEYHRVFDSHVFTPLYVSTADKHTIEYMSNNFVNSFKKATGTLRCLVMCHC